jgi:hypothetical protein
LGIAAKEVLQRLPDEVIREVVTAEVELILQHLPDCPDQVICFGIETSEFSFSFLLKWLIAI